ncbi:MAG: hypothetical protein OEY56_05310, partial [Cyclobacteriaceae bacterium]|nr:hypothetical protein [Cyclobacteriaceae bacterium]
AGSMGRALSESEQSEDLVFEDFQEWMRACFKPDFTALTAMSEKFSQLSKARQRGFVTYAIELVRQSLLVQAGGGLTMSEGSELAFVSKFSQTLPFEILEKVYQQLNLAILHLQRNANARITHLALSIRISLLMRQG